MHEEFPDTASAAARHYVDRGYQPRPLPRGEKELRLKGWPELEITPENVGEHFPDGQPRNIALQTGSVSGGLVAVDLDVPEAVLVARELMPPTGMLDGRPGKEISHAFFRSPDFKRSVSFKDPAGKTLVEIRAEKSLTLVPPSSYDIGESLRWIQFDEPAEIDGATLKAAVARMAAAILLARVWPAEGSRHDFSNALAGFLLRAGVGQEVVEQVVRAAANAAGDDEVDARVRNVQSTADAIASGTEATGGPTLEELVDDARVLPLVAKWLGVSSKGRARREGAEHVAARLVQIGQEAELFHDPDSEPYASIECEGHRETYRIGSTEHKQWLRQQYHGKYGKPPTSGSLSAAIGVLEALAVREGAEHPVHLRVAGADGRIYIDLADAARACIVVEPGAWSIARTAPVYFRRASGMLPLPEPVRGGTLDEFRGFVNVGSDNDYRLLLAWTTAALLPRGPYPVLMLNGPQGSAKSSVARAERALIDPGKAPLVSRPREDRELSISAANSWVQSFDNLSGMQESFADALCRLATGGGLRTRRLYTDDEERIFDAQRPIILNGIDEFGYRADLADRGVLLSLPSIAEDARRPEGDLWTEFEAARPRILGALLDALAGGLKALPDVRLDRLPRMADFGRWGVALEVALGWPEGMFMAAYAENRRLAYAVVLDADVVAQAVMAFLDGAGGEWRGTASELLPRLRVAAEYEGVDTGAAGVWPRSPNQLSRRLNRAAPVLARAGVEVTTGFREGADSRRMIELRRDPLPGSESGSEPDDFEEEPPALVKATRAREALMI